MKVTPDLHLAFDVGHSSIGWAVLQTRLDQAPDLLGCGAVIFPADDCLASQRRGFRRQRRHIRATRLRIARLRRLFEHLGVLTKAQLETGGCAWPWLLSARVLRGGPKLTWSELWDVLRWYAHNRGYDGNKGWSRQDAVANDEDTEKEKKAHELLDDFAKRHGRSGTMAEVFCDVLKIDPLGVVKSSMLRVRNLGAAFPREGVEAEVERILRAHLGVLPHVDEALVTAIMRDHTALAGPDYRLPARYGQRVNGQRTPGGLLFGQLIPRFDNRIISRCPLTYQRVYDWELASTKNEEHARCAAEKIAKVPSADCPEFYRFRWAMQLANVQIMTGDARKTRRLTAEERKTVHAAMERQGYFSVGTSKHPGEFMKAVRALTAGAKDNLDQMLALPDADKSLVLDPAKKRVAGGVLAVLWPHLMTAEEREEMEKNPAQLSKLQRHTLTNLRRGKAITARTLLEAAPAAQSAFDKWWDGEAMKTPRKTRKNGDATPRTREQVLGESHALKPDPGRAPFTRLIMREVFDFVLKTDRHPADGTEGAPDNGPLFRSEAIRNAQLQRAIDEQTNNHLVRHRLKVLERLHGDILQEYAANHASRIARITIEVNRDLKEMSGKTAQEQAQEQGQQTAQFRGVEKKLTAAYEGLGVHLGPGLIRKGRIAEDLGWKCPYTGADYDALDLLHRRVDKDHIIPRSQRASDSLDSLVITFSEINQWKGNRTAVQFVEEEEGKPVPGRPNIQIKTLTNFTKDVVTLPTKGYDDDERRKKNRKRLLALRDYVEKEFTPGDLTKTSQLVRLGAQALHKHYLGAEKIPVITSLPGSVTGAVRKSWNLIGCLALANPLVLNPEDLDEDGKPKVHRKTEIRGITHLHHALDACVLGFASLFLPRDGATWNREVIELLSQRRLTLPQQAILRDRLKHHVQITSEGEPRIKDLESELREQLRHKLAERRVVQHLPRDLSGMESKETVWRLFDPSDPHLNARRLARWLTQAEVQIPAPEAKTALIICRKRKNADAGEGESVSGDVFHEGKIWRWVYAIKDKSTLLGLAPEGDPAEAKLKRLKAVKVLGNTFGVALDTKPEPTLIRPHKVWHQLEKLRAANGGKPVRVLRKGMLIQVPPTAKRYPGIWAVRGIAYRQRDGFTLEICPPDYVKSRKVTGAVESASLLTLLCAGVEILPASLVGIKMESLTGDRLVVSKTSRLPRLLSVASKSCGLPSVASHRSPPDPRLEAARRRPPTPTSNKEQA